MLVSLVAAISAVSQAQSQTLSTHHVRPAILNGEAKLVGPLPATQTMHFDVVLALRHQPELENFLQELYDPSSSSYRQFVTPQQFTERFGPSQEDYDALIALRKLTALPWLAAPAMLSTCSSRARSRHIEKAFHVTMGVYQHPTENRTFFSPDREPTADLSVRLWHISGLDNYSIPRPALVHKNIKVKSDATTGSCPEKSFCGSDMRAAYYGGTLSPAPARTSVCWSTPDLISPTSTPTTRTPTRRSMSPSMAFPPMEPL